MLLISQQVITTEEGAHLTRVAPARVMAVTTVARATQGEILAPWGAAVIQQRQAPRALLRAAASDVREVVAVMATKKTARAIGSRL